MKVTGLLTYVIQGYYHTQGHGSSPGCENELHQSRDWCLFLLVSLAPSKGPGTEWELNTDKIFLYMPTNWTSNTDGHFLCSEIKLECWEIIGWHKLHK